MNRMKPDSAADRTGKSEKSEETGKKRKDRDGRGGVKPGGTFPFGGQDAGFQGFPGLIPFIFLDRDLQKAETGFCFRPFPSAPPSWDESLSAFFRGGTRRAFRCGGFFRLTFAYGSVMILFGDTGPGEERIPSLLFNTAHKNWRLVGLKKSVTPRV
ncbi:MAG: hypothetical protein CW346_01450 [Bacillaceae bacterium]|jgi:hypothetical protein|nr:hypothetical protein [Bacillaceae bacterium]